MSREVWDTTIRIVIESSVIPKRSGVMDFVSEVLTHDNQDFILDWQYESDPCLREVPDDYEEGDAFSNK